VQIIGIQWYGSRSALADRARWHGSRSPSAVGLFWPKRFCRFLSRGLPVPAKPLRGVCSHVRPARPLLIFIDAAPFQFRRADQAPLVLCNPSDHPHAGGSV